MFRQTRLKVAVMLATSRSRIETASDLASAPSYFTRRVN
jgi:hypothetical protein